MRKQGVLLPPRFSHVIIFFVLTFFLSVVPRSAAVFRVWQGGSGVAWSTPANWSPVGAPQAGDDLHFPSTTLAANRTASNDISGIKLNSILFNVPMTVLGLSVTVSNGISSSVIAVGSVSVICPIVLGADEQFLGDQRDLSFIGGINLNGNTLTFNAVGNNSAQILVPSPISGVGNILKIGVGTMMWQGLANTFNGKLRVEDGLVQFNKTSSQNCVVNRLEIAGPGVVQLLQSDQIFNLCTVVLETGGQFLLNGQQETLSDVVELWDNSVIDGGGNYISGGLFLLVQGK